MELVDVITNAGAMAAVAYLVLAWNREDTKQHLEKLAELNQHTAEVQKLTAEALQRLGDTLDTMTEKLTRIEERTARPNRTTKEKV